jgi:hypothetical protein
VKRRKLLQHLRKHGCHVVGEGGEHTHVLNPANGQKTTIPRHREVEANLARLICKQLGIPLPAER